MGIKYGFQGKVYYNATLITGSVPGSSWVEIANAKDVTIMDSMQEAEVETKGAAGVQEVEPTSILAGLEFSVEYDPADTATLALETAYRARTALAFGAMDAAMATTGTKGLVFNGKVLKFEKSQGMGATQRVAITVKPCFGSKLQAYTVP